MISLFFGTKNFLTFLDPFIFRDLYPDFKTPRIRMVLFLLCSCFLSELLGLSMSSLLFVCFGYYFSGFLPAKVFCSSFLDFIYNNFIIFIRPNKYVNY